MAACLQRALYLKSCLFLWVSTYELYSSTSLHAHRRILMSSSKYNMLKVTWKIYTSGKVTCFLHGRPPECRVAAVIKKKKGAEEILTPVHSGFFSFLFFFFCCVLFSSSWSLSLTSLLKIRSRALWYSSSLSSIDLLCLSREGWWRPC